MNTLVYLSYNNYYNRILKRKNTLNEYLSAGDLCGEIKSVNFFPADGIRTEHRPYLNALQLIPDYLIVTDEDTDEIKSRWFVIECEYITGALQYRCSLLRDLIADFWDDVTNKPFFCEKGWLFPQDSAIFNDEAITVNQIKRGEYPIKDGSNVPWIVGYMALPESGEEDHIVTYSTATITPDFEVANLEDWEYYRQKRSYIDDWNVSFYVKDIVKGHFYVPFRPDAAGNPEPSGVDKGSMTLIPGTSANFFAEKCAQNANLTTFKSAIPTAFEASTNTSMSETDRASFLNLNGKIVKDTTTGKTYQVYLRKERVNVTNAKAADLPTSELFEIMSSLASYSSVKQYWTGAVVVGADDVYYSQTYTTYTVSLGGVTLDAGSITIKPNRRPLYDAPYCMFCIPYGEYIFRTTTQITQTTSALDGINVATAIAAQLQPYIYDIQLLPYCPIEKLRYHTREELPPIVQSMVEGQDYAFAYDDNDNRRTVLFWAETSSGSFSISEDVWKYSMPNDALTIKLDNQTLMTRLCSPNYNGVFEFSPTKNKGVDYYNIAYTYKPYQPYIRIAPNFNGLYGANFDDARGLILGGDFSIATINDQWKTYEINNKNYQEMFNRQIGNMETQHKYQKIEQITSGIVGTISGGVTGGMAGGSTGNPWAAIAGAAIGTAASGAGAIADYKIQQALRNEAIDYTKDQFGYQLDNIKALPHALTRISAFAENNKLFPFIEVYTCTDEEREAVKSKIIYNGMTIERISEIQNFLRFDGELGYIKGKLIRLDTVAEDAHLIYELSNELYKGVYVNVDTI